MAEKDGPRAIRDGRLQRVEVPAPAVVSGVQRNQPRNVPGQPHPLEHPCIRGIGDDHFVAGIGQCEQRVEHVVALA